VKKMIKEKVLKKQNAKTLKAFWVRKSPVIKHHKSPSW
jgi:hypothetical protein